jgi:hypothetical protein
MKGQRVHDVNKVGRLRHTCEAIYFSTGAIDFLTAFNANVLHRRMLCFRRTLQKGF